MTRMIAVAAAVLALPLAACEATPCTPTATEAKESRIVNTDAVIRSGVLEATLSAEDGGLPGKTVAFSIDGESVGTDETDAAGVARIDLKRKPLKLVKSVGADSYDAVFAGDFTYCASSDVAPYKIAEV